MVNLATKTAVALLEFERLGRLSTTTRDDLVDALDDEAAGRVVEVGDGRPADPKPSSAKGAQK